MFAILLHESMDPFYQNISSFPTVILTFLLALCVLYWLIAVLGLVDVDVFDFGDLDINDSSHSAPDVLAGLMLKLGLVGVPVTIIVSFIALFGWLICYFVVHFLFGLVPDGVLRYLAGLPVLIGSIYIATLMTAQIIKPLRPLFSKAMQQTVKHVLGQVAIVRTNQVDNTFGEAMLDDGGAGLILKVRATGDEVFSRGDRVVLLEYLDDSHAYRVVSEAEFSGNE